MLNFYQTIVEFIAGFLIGGIMARYPSWPANSARPWKAGGGIMLIVTVAILLEAFGAGPPSG